MGSSQTWHAWVKLRYGRQSTSVLKRQIFTWKSSVDSEIISEKQDLKISGSHYLIATPNFSFFSLFCRIFMPKVFSFFFSSQYPTPSCFIVTLSNRRTLIYTIYLQIHALMISRVMWKNSGVNHSNLEKIGSSHSVLPPKDTATRGTPRVTRPWWWSLVLPPFWINSSRARALARSQGENCCGKVLLVYKAVILPHCN